MLMLLSDLRQILKLGVKDRRTWRFFFQHLWRGWSDLDTWNIDLYVARKVQPVMKRYSEYSFNLISTPGHRRAVLLACREIDRYVESDASCEYTLKFQRRFADKLTYFWW